MLWQFIDRSYYRVSYFIHFFHVFSLCWSSGMGLLTLDVVGHVAIYWSFSSRLRLCCSPPCPATIAIHSYTFHAPSPTRPDFHPPPTLPCQFTLIFPPPRPLPPPRHSLHCSENPAILSVAFIHCILICGSGANVLALFLLKAFLSSFDVFKHDVFAIVYIILYTSCT